MMKHLLVGNGANIQFDSLNYTPKQIVLRILKNFDREDFPSHIICEPRYLQRNYIGILFLEARNILDGKYDDIANCSAERDSLRAFKEQYNSKRQSLRITDIGFEDYYLIHDLVCHKSKTVNPDQYQIREALKSLYIFSVYNDGKVNELYKSYPKEYIGYLSSFDSIFTTNYDSNIEAVCSVPVFHIHGQFDKFADVYNPDSFRNKLPDCPIATYHMDEQFSYLYSNVLSTHCVKYKEISINQNSLANDAVNKLAKLYLSDNSQRKAIDHWCDDGNKLVANMGYAIKLKATHPELTFTENYHFDKFQKIDGSLEILGLSPWNDFHIFESINNSHIDKCVYYYFSKDQVKKIQELLSSLNQCRKLSFYPVQDFWSEHK